MGDEGKGTTVDHLCGETKTPIVVRFSGGAQSGHSVVKDLTKHVHSNVGSGTFRHNTPTYFSEHCSIYLTSMLREIEILALHGIFPTIVLHPMCKIITPYDIDVDQHKNKYSSRTCGLGLNVSMQRYAKNYKIHAIDLLNENVLFDKIEESKEAYDTGVILTKSLKAFTYAYHQLIRNTKANLRIRPYSFLKDYDTLIFEGSQGILLDKDHGIFPYVTHTNTTSKNALEVLSKLNISRDNIELYYVTRWYATRHGAGPFDSTKINLINTDFETNVENKYQGVFKVGELDYELVNYALNVDKSYSDGLLQNLVVTCLDQIPKNTPFEFQRERLNAYFSKIYRSFSPDGSKMTFIEIY